MDTPPHCSRWHSHKVWLGGLVALAACVAASPFSGSIGEAGGLPDGTVFPMGFPWIPETHEGRLAAMRLIPVMSGLAYVSGWLALSLLLGAVWSRVLRDKRAVRALALVPSLSAALELLQLLLWRVHEANPQGQTEWRYLLTFFHLPAARHVVQQGALALLGLGLLALLWRKVQGLRSRVTA